MEADLTQRARLVPSHSLYLLHGLADLTAPYMHGVAFAKALSEAGVIFRYQVRETQKYKKFSYNNIIFAQFIASLGNRVTRTKIMP